VLPGLGLALGVTLVYLSLIVLIPLSAVILETAGMGVEAPWGAVFSPRAWWWPTIGPATRSPRRRSTSWPG
jgi:ABC-type sulfate transport system permease component